MGRKSAVRAVRTPRSMRWLGIVATVLTVATSIVLSPTLAEPTAAISGSDFNPGLIISDAEFYNGQAMSQSDIQSFLDARVGSCHNGLCLNVLKQDTYSRPQDRTVCSSYTGEANESVARMIYKVQAACGISAKVLLVTLQKEMGLITSKAPSQWALNHAMGYACPDTAPCDSDKAGFYNQVYSAAWQFKRYSTPTPWGSYQPGWKTIGYHPNASCGSGSVYIQNNATAALYNYTPYQPNAAALANLGGVGDGCSSYGNRNFWVFYTNWFKSSGAVAMDQAYQLSGGEAGPLGAVVSSGYCSTSATVCSAVYANGSIYWNSYTGAWPVIGAIDTLYRSINGPSGSMRYPLTAHVAEVAAPGGFSQRFEGANAYSSSFGAFAVYGGIRTEFDRLGGPSGMLGWPLAGDECGLVLGGCLQRFENGVIYYSKFGTFTLPNAVNTAYEQLQGQSGVLGYPTARPVSSSANGGGSIYKFQNGSIYSSPDGAFPVFGSLESEYLSRGGVAGNLGWPTSGRVCTPTEDCVQTFQLGTLKIDAISEFASPRKDSLGPAIGPRSVESAAPGGASLPFRSATVYTYGLGTFAVYGVIRTEYGRLGGPGGTLGWPLAGDQCGLTGGGCVQQFEHGAIYYSPATGTRTVMAPVEALHRVFGAPLGSMAYPLTNETEVSAAPGGVVQRFQGANAYSSSLGSFAVFGVFRTEYERLGGPAGAMGWPVARDRCGLAGGGCAQQFEHGTLFYSPATGTRAVMGALDVLHRSLGEPLGSLSYPVSGETAVTATPNGVVQRFQGANAYSSSLGAFAVFGVFRTEYERLGGPAGVMGWPLAGDQCGLSGGGCVQKFEHGTMFYSPATGTRTVMGPLEVLHRSLGEPLGSLGYPVSGESAVSASPNGVVQRFQGANAYSSSLGSFAVFGVFRTEYERLGGPAGVMGWPVAGDQCGLAEGGCVQKFEHGTMFYSPATGTRTVMGALADLHHSFGEPLGSLAYPVSGETAVSAAPGGVVQRFQGANAYSSSFGAFAVFGVIRTEYERLGGPGGPLGWPLADDQCGLTGGGCTQEFEHGTIFYSPATGTWTVAEPMYARYVDAGGLLGPLGYPIANEVCDAGSCTQQFQGGTLP